MYWKALQTLSSATAIYHHSGDFTTIGITDFVLPFDAQFSLLSVHCDPGQSVGSQTYTLMVNDTATALACTITGSLSDCSDDMNVESVPADTLVTMRSQGSGVGVTSPDCLIVAKINDSNGNPYDAIVSWGGGGAAADNVGGRPVDGDFCGPGSQQDYLTECLGANSNDPVNAEKATFIVPIGGTLTGMGVAQHVAVAGGDTQTYTVVNVTANRDAGVSVTLNAGETKGVTSTCTNDCDVFPGDLLSVRFNHTGAGNTFAHRNIALTIANTGQIDTSRRSSVFAPQPTVGPGTPAPTPFASYGNFNSPWTDSVNTARAERDFIAGHLAIEMSAPPLAAVTASVCTTNASPPVRACGGTSLQCTVGIGDQTCRNDVDSMVFHAGDLYTVQIITTQGTGGPPAFAFVLSDVVSTPTATPTVIPTATDTATATETPILTATDTATATETPTETATETPTVTFTKTPTSTATRTPTSTALSTSTPFLGCCECPGNNSFCAGSCDPPCVVIPGAQCVAVKTATRTRTPTRTP